MGGKSDSMWDDWLIQSKENNPFLCGEWILNIYFNNSSKNSSWVCNAKWEFNDVQLLCLPMNEELAYLCMYLCGLSPFWNCNYTAQELLYWSLIQTAICISCWCIHNRGLSINYIRCWWCVCENSRKALPFQKISSPPRKPIVIISDFQWHFTLFVSQLLYIINIQCHEIKY